MPVSEAMKSMEELGELLIVDRVVDGEGADSGFLVGGIVAASGEHGVDGHGDGCVHGEAAEEAFAEDAEVGGARVFEVGAVLEVARVFGGASVDEAGFAGADDVVRGVGGFHVFREHVAERFGELFEADGVFDHFFGDGAGEGFVVGEEESAAAEVEFGFLVVSRDDGVVGALEEPVFAVVDELDGGVGEVGVDAFDAFAGDDEGGGYVVFGLDFFGGCEVLADGEGAQVPSSANPTRRYWVLRRRRR